MRIITEISGSTYNSVCIICVRDSDKANVFKNKKQPCNNIEHQ